MKDCKSTSQLIREFREANHVTQQAFADGVGVSKITVYRWEHGIAEPSMEHAKGIEAVFGLRLISPQNQVTYDREKTSDMGICESSETDLLKDPRMKGVITKALEKAVRKALRKQDNREKGYAQAHRIKHNEVKT